MIDINLPQFHSPTLTEIAGCNSVTFRAWRLRNGLFSNQARTGTGKKSWNLFSVVDIAVARTVVELIRHGFTAEKAIDIADFGGGIRAALSAILGGMEFSPYAAISASKDPGWKVVFLAPESSLGDFAPSGDAQYAAYTIINLNFIATEVARKILAGAEGAN